jgi:succinate dehydrogenase / fumarate reductase cytochrome b subunit
MLNQFFKVITSSIMKKFGMGVTGLLLCGFLVSHLLGNLLIFVGPQAYWPCH